MVGLKRHWMLGFIEASACFSIVIKRGRGYKCKNQVFADFSIKFPPDQHELARAIKKALGAGRIYCRSDKDRRCKEVLLKSTALDDVKRIAAFLKMGFVSKARRQEFEVWVRCISSIDAGEHLTKEGLLRIALLREDLHSRRQWNKKNYCTIRQRIDPCEVYKRLGSIPTSCRVCKS